MASINRRTIRWTTQQGEPRTAEKYEAVYRDRRGKRHRSLFALKKDAQRWLDEQTAGLVTGQWADPRAGRETVRAYGTRWLQRQILAPSTASTYATICPTTSSRPWGRCGWTRSTGPTCRRWSRSGRRGPRPRPSRSATQSSRSCSALR